MADDTFIELHDYRKSLESEFKLSPDDTPDIIRNKVRAFAIANLTDALESIADCLNSDKDATKLSAGKFIISLGLATTPNDEVNPIETLFTKLMPQAEEGSKT